MIYAVTFVLTVLVALLVYVIYKSIIEEFKED